MSVEEDLFKRIMSIGVRADELAKCCIGSRAAFAKLLIDRQSIADDDLLQIIQRLDKVIAEGK